MRSIALFTVTITALLITVNLQDYVHSRRIGYYSWHVFMPVIPLLFFLALSLGYLHKPDRATKLYYLWWVSFLFVISISLVVVESGSLAISTATGYASFGAITMSFLAVTQNRALTFGGGLGIACASVLAACVSFAEFLDPDFTMIVDQMFEYDNIKEGVISRVGGMHINPNENARAMVLGMFVSSFFLQKKFRLIFCLFMGAAVFTTVSRSGILTWALAMIMLTYLGQLSHGNIGIKFFGFITVALLGLLLTTGQIPKLIVAVGLDEYMNETMINRLSGGFTDQGDDSTSIRKQVIPLAIDIYTENPILGAGLGKSAQLGDTGIGPHNAVLEIAAELGTLGLIVYLSLFLIPWGLKSRKGLCFMILFTVSCMFGQKIMTKPTLAFILPAGVVLLSKLDQSATQASKVNLRRRRRKRSRSGNENRRTTSHDFIF